MNIPGLGIVTEVRNFLVALLIGLVAGGVFGGVAGWKIHAWKTDAAKLEQAQQTAREDAAAPVKAREDGEKLQKENRAIKTENDRLRRQLADAIPPTPLNSVKEDPNALCSTTAPQLCNCVPSTLSVGAVGLLNRALDGTAPDPAGWSDGEKRTPSENGLREVSDHLALIAGQCRELGKRHDALVDDVAAYQKKIQQQRQ
jgi:cell division protein FtsB